MRRAECCHTPMKLVLENLGMVDEVLGSGWQRWFRRAAVTAERRLLVVVVLYVRGRCPRVVWSIDGAAWGRHGVMARVVVEPVVGWSGGAAGTTFVDSEAVNWWRTVMASVSLSLADVPCCGTFHVITTYMLYTRPLTKLTCTASENSSQSNLYSVINRKGNLRSWKTELGL